MLLILVGENRFIDGNSPVYIKRGIDDRDAAVSFRAIVIVAFVLEDSCVAQNGETVGKAAGNEELAVIILGQLDGHMTAIGGRAFADIDGNVDDGSLDTSDELGLSEWRALEMEAAHNAASRARLVVLDKVDRADFLVELAL